MDDGWARLVVFCLGDPHGLEGGKGGEDGASNPDRVLSLRRSNNLDLHGGWSKSSELLGHTLTNAWEHGGTAGEDDVGVEVLSDIHITLHDGLESAIVDAGSLLSNEGWLEKHFWASESLVADNDHVAVWEFIGLLECGGLSSSLQIGRAHV